MDEELMYGLKEEDDREDQKPDLAEIGDQGSHLLLEFVFQRAFAENQRKIVSSVEFAKPQG